MSVFSCLVSLKNLLQREVSVGSLVAFRAGLGLILCCGTVRFLAKGWVDRLLLQPEFRFSYFGWDFIAPWPEPWMSLHYVSMAVFALGIAVGVFYRWCCVGFLVTFTYAELIDRSLFLNHYYLVTSLVALLCVLPAGRTGSVDAFRHPERVVSRVPQWVLWALRLQVGVVYFFAGVAKLNSDWLLHAQPLRIWLANSSDLPLVGFLLMKPVVWYLASWFGALFDLSILAVLAFGRTRAVGWALLVTFHLLTALLFPIGMFPWLMIVAASVWLPADWPDEVRGWWPRRSCPERQKRGWSGPVWTAPRALTAAVGLHCALQVLIPLRQHGIAQSAWTAQGFDFAWKVMLVEKVGTVTFVVVDRKTGETTHVAPSSFLAPFQEAAMGRDPQLIRQGAREIQARYRHRGHDVAVHADALASLNGRPPQRLIDPSVDLASASVPDGWILPLAR